MFQRIRLFTGCLFFMIDNKPNYHNLRFSYNKISIKNLIINVMCWKHKFEKNCNFEVINPVVL